MGLIKDLVPNECDVFLTNHRRESPIAGLQVVQLKTSLK
jgi:hypothetical protein